MPGRALLLLGESDPPTWVNSQGRLGNPWQVSLTPEVSLTPICSSLMSPAWPKGWDLWLWPLGGSCHPLPPSSKGRCTSAGAAPKLTWLGNLAGVAFLGSCLARLVELLSLKARRDVIAHGHRPCFCLGPKGVALVKNVGNASLSSASGPGLSQGRVPDPPMTVTPCPGTGCAPSPQGPARALGVVGKTQEWRFQGRS